MLNVGKLTITDYNPECPDTLDYEYRYKVFDTYEEEGVGPVLFYVLQDSNPKKSIANKLFKANPTFKKCYMVLRDYSCYYLPKDLVGRFKNKIKVYVND